jgi:ubiquinone/menaquinone biosynthesis C-methylase UbiE
MSFYRATLDRLVEQGTINKSAKILVVAGGGYDCATLKDAGFADVTISNLDVRMKGDEYAPFAWSFQDAEALDYPDGAFDYVIEHMGLHHCASPHRGLLEMYRVAAKGVVMFENRDSALMQLAIKFGLVRDHEVEAVVGNGYEFGGHRNTHMPNYIYRWTEREVTKAIACADPRGPVPCAFFYGLRLPEGRLAMGTAAWKRWALALLKIPVRLLFLVAKRQGNEFGVWIGKPSTRFDWLNADDSLDRAWLDTHFSATDS